MSQTITNLFVQQWDSTIRASAQQRESRLLSRVTNRGQITGESFTINNLGTLELDPNVVRHGDTEWGELIHSTRIALMKDFYKAVPLDRNDIPKMLVNPVAGGDYARELVNAKNRAVDDLIYHAALDPITLKDGTIASLPAGQIIVGGGTGITKAKVIQARTLFRSNETDTMAGEELTMLYNSVGLGEVLSDTTLTSADYLAGKMLQSGEMANWLGFTWVPYEKLNVSAGVYSTVAFTKSGIHFGEGYEEGLVTRRGDKKDLWQVSYGCSYGAGRQDEKKVVRIDFT